MLQKKYGNSPCPTTTYGVFMKADEEGSALFSRKSQHFFEPLILMWKMTTPEFDDSIAGIVRNREDFESDPIISLKGTTLGVVPMEIVETNISSLALESIQKKRRLLEKGRMSTENPEEHAYSVNGEAVTKHHPGFFVSLPSLSSEWDVGGRKCLQQQEQDKPFGFSVLSEGEPGPTPKLSTPGLQKRLSLGQIKLTWLRPTPLKNGRIEYERLVSLESGPSLEFLHRGRYGPG